MMKRKSRSSSKRAAEKEDGEELNVPLNEAVIEKNGKKNEDSKQPSTKKKSERRAHRDMKRKTISSSRRAAEKEDVEEYIADINDERASSEEEMVEAKGKKKGENKEQSRKKKGDGRSYRATTFQTKCSPSRLKGICDKLTERQREVVAEMGFWSLLDFRCTQLDRVLCKELVDCFDVQQYVMHIHGCRISVAVEDVGLIFGIPSSGITLPKECTSEVYVEVEDVKGRSNKELEGIIIQGNTDNTFRKAFLLYVLSIFLCPTTKEIPSPRLFPAVANHLDASMMNWAEFVLEWLVNELRTFRLKRFSRQSIGGCTFLLMMLYFHRRPIGGITSRFVEPVISDWYDEKLTKRMRLERKNVERLLYKFVDEGEKGWVHNNKAEEVTRTPNDVMKDKIYFFCTHGYGDEANKEVVGWHNLYLTFSEMRDLRPYGWLNSGDY